MTLALLALFLRQDALDHAAVQKTLDAKVAEIHQRTGAPGVSAAVVLADGTVVTSCAGYADPVAKTPMTPGTFFCAGSTGKMVVGAVVALLVTQGKLDLDEPLSQKTGDEPWFGRLPNAKLLTLRHLMNHTSGIPEHVQDPAFVKAGFAASTKVWKTAEILAYSLDKEPLFETGKGWSYADTNYVLAGFVVEKVTSKGLFAAAKELVLGPGKVTEVVPALSQTHAGLANGLNMENSPLGLSGPMLTDGKLPFNPQVEHGGGGTFTTPRGIAQWAKKLYEGQAVPDAAVKLIVDGVPSKLGRDQKYGLGCMVRPTPHGVSYGHGGWFPGYLTDVMYLPDKKVAIAVQVNTDDFRKMKGAPEGWNREILRALFPVSLGR